MGEKYFIDMGDLYYMYKKNQIYILKKYGVSYVVLDKENDKWVVPKYLKSVWSDGRFEIFMLN